MAKEKEPLDEKILRFVYNSKFYPEKEKDAYLFANPILDIVGGARSYDEARNLVIDAIKDAKNLERLRDISQFYIDTYGNEEDPWDAEKTFLGKFDLRPINADKRDLKDVLEQSEIMANALGYSGGLEAMLSKFAEESKGNIDGFDAFVKADLIKKLAENDKVRDRVYTMLDMSPKADDDYVAERIADFVGRSKRYRDNENLGAITKGVRNFFLPYESEKLEEGRKATPVDFIADIASDYGSGVVGAKYAKAKNGLEGLKELGNVDRIGNIGKLKKYAQNAIDLGGLGAVAGAIEPFETRLHDMIDAATSKKVYANAGRDDEWSESTSPLDPSVTRLEDLPAEVYNGIQKGIMRSMIGVGGRSVGRLLLETKAAKKFRSALEKLTGNRKSAKETYKDLMKEKREDKNAIKAFFESNKKDAELSPENLDVARRRVSQIERHEDAIRKIAENNRAAKAKRVWDAFVGAYVTRNALNPEKTKKNTDKAIYDINFMMQ